jgi:hypothetical protein
MNYLNMNNSTLPLRDFNDAAAAEALTTIYKENANEKEASIIFTDRHDLFMYYLSKHFLCAFVLGGFHFISFIYFIIHF